MKLKPLAASIGLTILGLVASAGSFAADAVGTAHRSLMVLERSGLIERTPENRFRLGLKLYQLGNRAVEQVDLRPRVQPFFRRLASQVRETVQLDVRPAPYRRGAY